MFDLFVVDKFCFVFFEYFGVESDEFYVIVRGGVIVFFYFFLVSYRYSFNRFVDFYIYLVNFCF